MCILLRLPSVFTQRCEGSDEGVGRRVSNSASACSPSLSSSSSRSRSAWILDELSFFRFTPATVPVWDCITVLSVDVDVEVDELVAVKGGAASEERREVTEERLEVTVPG